MSAPIPLLDNLSWKLLSLTLALLIWSGARLFMRQEIRPLVHPLAALATRDFRDLPVRLLTPNALTIPVRIDPPTVLVRVGGEYSILERLTDQDALAFVELTPELFQTPVTNRIEVRLPPVRPPVHRPGTRDHHPHRNPIAAPRP
jgi:hypothetical protein